MLCIGGPALVVYVSPSEEELFKVCFRHQHPCNVLAASVTNSVLTRIQRYNPDLQRRSLENRDGKQQAFDDYVTQLKVAAKSDKPSMPDPERKPH